MNSRNPTKSYQQKDKKLRQKHILKIGSVLFQTGQQIFLLIVVVKDNFSSIYNFFPNNHVSCLLNFSELNLGKKVESFYKI